jgi:drug/metabolite transporter (DMT)-like permease
VGIVAVITPSTAAGLGLAAGAAACFETGYAFQALEARTVPARHALRVSLLGRLLRNARWLAATALSVLGWPLQVAALTLAPLAVVQPTLALGLVGLLILGSRVLGEHIGRREIVAVALVVAGIACIALCAPGRGTSTNVPGAVVAVGLLSAVTAAPYVLRRRTVLLAVLATGAADSLAGFAAKLVADALRDEQWAVVIGLGVLAAGAGVMATLSEMSALQNAPATRVGPIVLAMQIVIPVVLGALVAGEDWGATPAGGLVLGAGLAVVVSGAVLLAASPAVGAVIARPGEAPQKPPTVDAQS